MKNVSDRSRAERGDAEVVAVVGGTIIDGNGGAPIPDGVILIDGKRVRAVGDRSMPIPPQAKQISAAGKFVIPGLIAPSQFLVEATWPPEMIRHEGRYDEVAIEAAQLALKGGVTTVFDTWGPRDPLIKARNAINEGRATGARIYVGGNWLGMGGPYSADMRPHFKEALGDAFVGRIHAQWEVNVGEALTRLPLEEARQEVRKYARSGVDFVMYPINVHQPSACQFITFSPRVQRMIVEEAHSAGRPVAAMFVTSEEGIHVALDAGVDMIAPVPWAGRPTSVETLALLAQRGIPTIVQVSPTETLEWYRRPPEGGLATPGGLKVHENMDLDHRALIRAGAQLVASAYMGVFSPDQLKSWSPHGPPGSYVQLGEGHVRCLQALQQKGMTPIDALMTQTRNVARAYKVDGDIGTLEPRKLADLVILGRDPLDNPQNYRDIHLVMKEGKVIDRDALPTQRLWTAPAVASN